MTKIIFKNLDGIFKYRERILQILIVAIIMLSGSYAYLLQGAVKNVVERGSIVKNTRVLSTAVSEMEAKYFSLKNNIDIDLAHSKGFKSSEINSFISKKSLTAMVNYANTK